MIDKRVYKPVKEDLLYHYCDANAFLAICQNRKIRFSDLFSMNDYLEMHWGYSIWEQAATVLLDEVGKEFLDKIDEIIHSAGLRGLVVASCFSMDGDVLSQWRAYADDGKGYAIGFSGAELIQLSVRPLKVLYERQQQVDEVVEVIRKLVKAEVAAPVKFDEGFRSFCYVLAYDLAAYKNTAFSEEKEIRLIHLLDLEKSNNYLRLVDAGGKYFGKEINEGQVMYRILDGVPTAFIEQDFSDLGKVNPIKEVLIGPKSRASPSDISIFLETNGIGSVVVKRSKASYK